jgi:L-malate glycosyltransferase
MRDVEVQQFLTDLFPVDAVSEHTLATRRALHEAGMGGHIWAEAFDPQYRLVARRYHRYGYQRGRMGRTRRVLLYQMSTGSNGIVDMLHSLDAPLTAYYHNITPPEFFYPFDVEAAERMRRGREQLCRLAPRISLAFAASRFSADELRTVGVSDVRLLPPFAAPDQVAPDEGYLRRLRDGKRGIDLLFVGRVSPHKGHQQLLRVLALLAAGAGLEVRLFIVGRPGPHTYLVMLHRVVTRLGLDHRVIFTGTVSHAQLAAHYRAADLFLCLSEHEGFCLPLLEAMRNGLPVVAHEAGAVSELVSDAGLLLRSRDPLVVAEAVMRVATGQKLRRELVECQHMRARQVESMRSNTALLDAMREVANT